MPCFAQAVLHLLDRNPSIIKRCCNGLRHIVHFKCVQFADEKVPHYAKNVHYHEKKPMAMKTGNFQVSLKEERIQQGNVFGCKFSGSVCSCNMYVLYI